MRIALPKLGSAWGLTSTAMALIFDKRRRGESIGASLDPPQLWGDNSFLRQGIQTQPVGLSSYYAVYV
jgi:hypothetical protein